MEGCITPEAASGPSKSRHGGSGVGGEITEIISPTYASPSLFMGPMLSTLHIFSLLILQ